MQELKGRTMSAKEEEGGKIRVLSMQTTWTLY
jgi:hypothetical protein